MTVDLDLLRLVSALAHSAPDADVELGGPGRRWVVSYRRPSAVIDPCGFRQLVLASMRGCQVGLLPAERVEFVGGMQDIGGGVFHRRADGGTERWVATYLCAGHVESILTAAHCDAGDGATAHVRGDDELGVTVVTIATADPRIDHRLDVIALSLASAFMVEELIQASDREASP
jgi:hypothetical protein